MRTAETFSARFDRRNFLANAVTGFGAAWVTANWPGLLAASAHARAAAGASTTPKFEFFTNEQAIEVAAIAARIIPSDGSPGATEAGAVYFIDRGLMTVAVEDQARYRSGLLEFQEDIREMFPGIDRFSAASIAQQDQFLRAQENVHESKGRRFPAPDAPSFFDTIRTHTVAAFLIDPESEYAGNRSGVGWQMIGREPGHAFQSPFGFYDKDYAGWSATPDPEKSK
jgi:Gluconate 2-dehydrogenase subunit 3